MFTGRERERAHALEYMAVKESLDLFIYSLIHPSIPSFTPPFTHSSIHWLVLSSNSKRLSGVRTVLGSGNSLVNKLRYFSLQEFTNSRASHLGQWQEKSLEHEQCPAENKTEGVVLSLDFCLEGSDGRIFSWELVLMRTALTASLKNGSGETRVEVGRELQVIRVKKHGFLD